MRTNIDIDDDLMAQALAASGARTKKEAVTRALETMVRLARQKEIRHLRGALEWEGDLEASRTDVT